MSNHVNSLITEIDVSNPPKRKIFVGHIGETGFRKIVFLVDSWKEEFPDGTPTLVFKRADGKTYPVSISQNADGYPVFIPSSTETSFAGDCVIQLRWTQDGVLGKTCNLPACVESAIGSVGPLPDDDVRDYEAEISANTNARHTHNNKNILDEITAQRIAKWDEGGSGGGSGLAYELEDNGETLYIHNLTEAPSSDDHVSITVDVALSSSSTNPVQNKAIKAALDAKANASDIPSVPQMATAADMSDWTQGKTVDAAVLKTDFQGALQMVSGKQDTLTAGQNITISGNTISADVDPTEIASNVTNWLDTNVTPVGSAVVVDSSLSVSGAAADAKKTGDYIDRLNDVNFLEGKNIFDAEFKNAQISNGVYTDLTNGYSKIAEEEYIPVDGGEKYTLSFIAAKSYINLYISGYDASKTLIDSAFPNVFVGVKETAFSTLLNVPAGCSYVRFYAYRDQEPYENMIPTNIQLEKGTVATEYEPPNSGGAIIPMLREELDEVKSNVSVKSVNMLDVVFTNSRVQSDGTFATLSTGTTHTSHAELIEVEPSAEYVLSWIPTELMIHCYVYEYDSAEGYLTYTRFSTNRATPARAEKSFTVGSTTKYIRLDFYRESVAWQELIPDELQLQIGHTPTDYEEPGEIFAIPVLEKKVAELDGGYLPDYYEAYLPAKIEQIKTLLKTSVVNGDAFYFITDMHWDKNTQNSPAIIKRMNKELRIDKLFTGGDITPNGYSDQPVNKLMDAMGGKNLVYGINGNHEFLDDATYADIFYMQSAVLPDSVVFGNREKNYYYFDNHKQQIRYIVLAAFGEAVNGAAVSLYTDADQLSWLTNTALDVDSGWTIIILTHSYYSTLYNGGAWGGAIQESPPQTDHGFTNAIKDYVQNGNGEIACIIIGHLHYDRIFEIEGMPKVVAVTCDKYAPWIENGTDREPWLAERVPGTVTEQAFDVVILDKTARTVKFVRVGGDAYDGINGSFGNAVQIRTISY